MLKKSAAGASFCNILKYKINTFYLSRIQKLAPDMHMTRLLHVLHILHLLKQISN